jgi:hypothetical protein
MVKRLIGGTRVGVQDSVYGNNLPHHTYIDRGAYSAPVAAATAVFIIYPLVPMC